MRPPGCTLILLQQGGPRRELIATSLWEPTGWINRHLPGIDPRPMTGKKCRAAGSLSVTRQLGFLCRISFVSRFELSPLLLRVILIDVVFLTFTSFLLQLHFFDLRTGGMLASCAC